LLPVQEICNWTFKMEVGSTLPKFSQYYHLVIPWYWYMSPFGFFLRHPVHINGTNYIFRKGCLISTSHM
jgi:hypothetical protein